MHTRSEHQHWIGFVCLLLLATQSQAQAAPDRIRVLIVQRATGDDSHLSYPVVGDGEARDYNLAGVGVRSKNPNAGHHEEALSNAFWKTIAGYDRNTEWFRALERAFAQRAPLFEITSTADVLRYFRSDTSPTLTAAAHAEKFSYVITLSDRFIGLTALDDPVTIDGLVTPYNRVGYALYESAGNKRLAGDSVSAAGFMSQPISKAIADATLFTRQWPFMCAVNADELVDKLLRKDTLHDMAQRLGRGAEVPAVAAKLAQLESSLEWRLDAAPGWRELRLITNSSARVLEPRDSRLNRARMVFEVDYLLPELGQSAASVSDYLPIWLRRELLRAPLTEVQGPFTDISAPGYEAYRLLGPAKEHLLVFFKRTDDGLMRVVRVSLAGDFEAEYPRLKPAIEQMLARSTVNLAARASQ